MPELTLHNPNEMGSGLYDIHASTPKSLSTTPHKSTKKLSNIPNPNLDKDIVNNYQPVQNLGTMKDNIPQWRMNKNTGVNELHILSDFCKFSHVSIKFQQLYSVNRNN